MSRVRSRVIRNWYSMRARGVKDQCDTMVPLTGIVGTSLGRRGASLHRSMSNDFCIHSGVFKILYINELHTILYAALQTV